MNSKDISLSVHSTETTWRPLRKLMGFPGGTNGKEPAYQYWRRKRHGFDPWAGEISWRRAWHPTPVFLPGKSHGLRILVGYSPKGCKELDMTEQLSTHVRRLIGQWGNLNRKGDWQHFNRYNFLWNTEEMREEWRELTTAKIKWIANTTTIKRPKNLRTAIMNICGFWVSFLGLLPSRIW